MHKEAPADVCFSHYQSAPAFKRGCFCVTHPLWWAYRNKKLELFDGQTTRPSTSGTNNLVTDTSALNDIVKRRSLYAHSRWRKHSLTQYSTTGIHAIQNILTLF